ncbi:MAG: serine/threonine protein kinase [Gemmatimonadetes bacterium]|nr:serine/threonine protein kinase [Gemmatimonadota bacterium]
MSEAASRLNSALQGRYRIERELGEGGMANVYLADDLKHERKVALKVLKPELAAVVGAERFLAEIKTTANLTHPSILPLHDSGEADGFLFYVMPHIEGESLRDRLEREHQLPVDDAARIALEVAEGLDYAHSCGVIHRDIKPANILLQAGRPLIADFGIALAVSSSGGARLTDTGLSLGTPHYMSPEQATGDQEVGAATDIWALGCVLYEMLVGDPPFLGSTPQAVLGKILTEHATRASTIRHTVPGHVDAVAARALERVAADRFANAGELAAALSRTDFAWSPGGENAPRLWRSRVIGAAAVSAAVLGALWAFDVVPPTGDGRGLDPPLATVGAANTSEDTRTRVLVFPPEDRTGDPAFASLPDRMAGALRGRLLRDSEADVARAAQTEESSGMGRTKVVELIRESGATHAITGTLFLSGDSLLVTLEVLDSAAATVRVLDELSISSRALDRVVSASANQATAAVLDLMYEDGFEFRSWSLPRTVEAMRLYNRAGQAFSEGRNREAVGLLVETIEAEPDWPRPYWFLRQASGMAGQPEIWPEFEADFERLRPRLSADEELFITWQRTPNNEERLEIAEYRFDRAGGASTTGYMLAWPALMLGRLDQALTAIEAQDFDHAQMREWPYAWMIRGQIYHLTGDYELELARAREGRGLMPERFWFRFFESRALLALNQEEAALSVYSELTEIPVTAQSIDPTSETRRLWNALHEASFEFGVHGSLELEARAIEIFAEWALTRDDLSRWQQAQTLYRLGRYEESIPLLEAELEEASGLDRLGPGALLAIALDRTGRSSRADEVEDGLTFPSGSSSWRYQWIALAAAGRGDTNRAISILAHHSVGGVTRIGGTEDFLHFRPELEQVRQDPRFQQWLNPEAN